VPRADDLERRREARRRERRRGEDVATLVPAHPEQQPINIAAVDDMLALMRSLKAQGEIDLKALIDEGRL
jgi:hypothetical protein